MCAGGFAVNTQNVVPVSRYKWCFKVALCVICQHCLQERFLTSPCAVLKLSGPCVKTVRYVCSDYQVRVLKFEDPGGFTARTHRNQGND